MEKSIAKMTDRIVSVTGGNVHSIWLYGSVVLNDYQAGWSDIDIVVLTNGTVSEAVAEELMMLRQTMQNEEPDNQYYRSFEGIIADVDEYRRGTFTRLVYWGTSGQRVTDKYNPDTFSLFELAKYGRSVYGSSDRSIFPVPSAKELTDAVRFHYNTIRKYAVQTNESLYSCGWLLDIARCIYTLRSSDVIAKTQAGKWALDEHVFPDEAPLRKALEIREHPLEFIDREDVREWLKGLGPTVQEYADVLEKELERF